MSASANNTMSQRPITEQIEELKAKMALLDGDRKAYYESSQWAMNKNMNHIKNLRKENNAIRQKLSDSLAQDEYVIDTAFKDKPTERASLKNKSGTAAITVMDHKVSDISKQLNALQHQAASKQKKLEEIQTHYNEMVKDAEDAVATDKGESESAQKMRYIENSHDKAQMKLREAMHLHRIYKNIKTKLQNESLNFNNRLNGTESDIKRCQNEHNDLKSMQNDAQISKDMSSNELRKYEVVVYSDRKKREIELTKMKKEAEEKKLQNERIEKRITARGSISAEELITDKNISGEEQQQIITSYEEAFKKIKECTGVSDTQEVVQRFECQGDTGRHLDELRKDGEKHIMRLKEEKDRLQQDFEEMKYSGEAKLSSGQRRLEETEAHLNTEEDRRDEATGKLKRGSKVLVSVKAGVEHLAEKLQHLKASKGHVPTVQIQPTSDEYVLDQLSTCEEKLLKLLEELDGKNLNDIVKEMEAEQFFMSIENKLPTFNTRIKLPQTQKDNVYDDEDDSGEDDTDVPNRNTIKKQSQFIIDAKTKRRTTRKKKKMK